MSPKKSILHKYLIYKSYRFVSYSIAQEVCSIICSSLYCVFDVEYTLNEHKSLHFDNDYGIYMSSKFYEECGYDLDVDLLTILY